MRFVTSGCMSVAARPESSVTDHSSAEAEANVFNPFARLRLEHTDGEPATRIHVAAFLRGRGWQHTVVAERDQPGLHALLRGILTAEGEVDVELTAEQIEALR